MHKIRLRHMLIGTLGAAALAVAAATPASATGRPLQPVDAHDCVMAGPCGHADYWPHGWPPPPPTSWPTDPL